MDRVDWLHRCELYLPGSSDIHSRVGLHIPTFLRSCGDLWALPPDQVVHEISLPFIALYLTVCMVSSPLPLGDQSS
jgi:hypothetical protein